MGVDLHVRMGWMLPAKHRSLSSVSIITGPTLTPFRPNCHVPPGPNCHPERSEGSAFPSTLIVAYFTCVTPTCPPSHMTCKKLHSQFAAQSIISITTLQHR